jgi:hypothetical protein
VSDKTKRAAMAAHLCDLTGRVEQMQLEAARGVAVAYGNVLDLLGVKP